MEENRKRYIGLDVHKHYLIALGVDVDLNVGLPARRVELAHLEAWMKKSLTQQDEVVLEMTTNTWQLYDELVEYAGSVIVVHPPHVALLTRSQVTPAPTAGTMILSVTRTNENGGIVWLAAGSEVDAHWCREPEPQADPTTRRHPSLSPPAKGEHATQNLF